MAFALITGASGGIGLAIAKELAKGKNDLLLIARSGDKLAQIASSLQAEYGVQAKFLSCDLSKPDGAKKVMQWVSENSYPVHMLVNNAGYGIWKSIEGSDLQENIDMMTLNINSLVSLCHLIIPELKKHSKAYILNVASTAAYQAVPSLAVYSASKAFVILFSRSLRIELDGSPISVSCVSPGTTSTGFIERAGMDALKDKAEKVSMSPEEVARIALKGMYRGNAEIIPGFLNQLSVKLTYFLPKWIPEKIATSLYLKK